MPAQYFGGRRAPTTSFVILAECFCGKLFAYSPNNDNLISIKVKDIIKKEFSLSDENINLFLENDLQLIFKRVKTHLQLLHINHKK